MHILSRKTSCRYDSVDDTFFVEKVMVETIIAVGEYSTCRKILAETSVNLAWNIANCIQYNIHFSLRETQILLKAQLCGQAYQVVYGCFEKTDSSKDPDEYQNASTDCFSHLEQLPSFEELPGIEITFDVHYEVCQVA